VGSLAGMDSVGGETGLGGSFVASGTGAGASVAGAGAGGSELTGADSSVVIVHMFRVMSEAIQFMIVSGR